MAFLLVCLFVCLFLACKLNGQGQVVVPKSNSRKGIDRAQSVAERNKEKKKVRCTMQSVINLKWMS